MLNYFKVTRYEEYTEADGQRKHRVAPYDWEKDFFSFSDTIEAVTSAHYVRALNRAAEVNGRVSVWNYVKVHPECPVINQELTPPPEEKKGSTAS